MGDEGKRRQSEAIVAGDQIPRHWDDSEWLRQMLGAVPAFITRLDQDDRLIYINRLQAGFELEHVLGRTGYEFIEPEYHGGVREALERARSTGEPQRYVVKGGGPDGTRVFYESIVTSVGPSGDTVTLSFDVSGHVELTEALRASEEQLRLAIAATGLGLWSWDRKTGEVLWNDRMHEITGCAEAIGPDEWIGTLVVREDVDRVASEVGAAQTGRLPHRIKRPDGTVRWVLLIGQDAAVSDTLVRGGVLDTTHQCELEARLRDSQRREVIGTLTTGVAHNFNNMLAVIQPSIELAMTTAEGAAKTALSDALHASRGAAQLVTQLMTYAGQRTSARRDLSSVRALVDTAVRMCRHTFDKQMQLSVDAGAGDLVVRCDVSDLEQLLLNLLINARDAASMRSDPAIVVEISEVETSNPNFAEERPGQYVRVQIRDNGIGMTRETLDRVFEPFFTEKGPGKGTGLGLATSYAIAREHGGWIAFESQAGEGTRANVFLPAAEGTPETIEPPAATQSDGSVRILLVEDEGAIRNIVSAVLGELGHIVVTAESATEAAELLDQGEPPQIVLLDRSMPGWPARRAVSEVRKRAAGARILFFTGQSVPADELELVDGVVYKPISIQDLEAAILRCLAQS